MKCAATGAGTKILYVPANPVLVELSVLVLYNNKLSSDEEAVGSRVNVFDACKLIFGKSTALSGDSTCKAALSFGLLVPIVCPKAQNDVNKNRPTK